MLRNLVVLGVVALLPAFVWAQPEAGDWELTLTGNGSSVNDFNSTTIGAGGQLGYFISKPFEVGVRQSVSYSHIEHVGHSWDGSTRIFADWHFDLDKFQPFVGANIGYAYGDTTNDSWLAALEGGLKYYVHRNAFIYGQIEYQWLLRDSFSDGSWVYSIGIGTNW